MGHLSSLIERRLFVPLVLLSVTASCEAPALPGQACVQLSADAEEWVDSVLQAGTASRENPHEGPAAWTLGCLLYGLREEESTAADEASAALLSFYLGEANGVDVLNDVARRGQRMLPHLRPLVESEPCTSHAALLLAPDQRVENVQAALDLVAQGKTLQVD
jgi:hypothetical protein